MYIFGEKRDRWLSLLFVFLHDPEVNFFAGLDFLWDFNRVVFVDEHIFLKNTVFILIRLIFS